jgi:hypothetical protein
MADMVVPEKVAPPIMSDWSANNMGTTSLLRVMSPASQSSDFGAHDDAAGVVQCVVSPFDDRTMDTFFLAPNLVVGPGDHTQKRGHVWTVG